MRFHFITEDDFKDILLLTNSEGIMRHIKQGKLWDQAKVEQFIQDNLQDKEIPIVERNYINFKIEDKGKFVGLLFLKKWRQEWYLTIMIAGEQQHKGYFNQSMEELKTFMNKYFPKVEKIIVETHLSNHIMVHILDRKMVYHQEKRIGKIMVRQYYFFLRPYTYMIRTQYTDPAFITQLMDKHGWKKVNKDPDFLYLEGKYQYDKKYYSTKCYLKNLSDTKKREFSNKEKLYQHLKKESYIPKFHLLDLNKRKFVSLKNKLEGKVWILKPSAGWAGDGIKMILSEKDLAKMDQTEKNKYQNWILQEYITNPLLHNKYKFHLRCLFLYRDNGEGYIFKTMPAYLAPETYSIDYSNPKEHISHYSKEQKALYYPRDFKIAKKDQDLIMLQITKIFKDIMDITYISCYPGIERCYEVFGADLMICSNYEVKLLEVNEKIGLKEFENDKLKFNQLLFESQIKTVVNDVFPSKLDIEDDFIKL